MDYPDDKRQYHRLVRVIVQKLESKCAKKKLKLTVQRVDATDPHIVYYYYSLAHKPRGNAYKDTIQTALSNIREIGTADSYIHADKIILTYPHQG